MKKILILFSLLFTGVFYSQNREMDSLIRLLKTDREDTNKINHLNALAFIKKRNYPDTAIILSNQALIIANGTKQMPKWKKGIADSYNNIGSCNLMKGNADTALSYFSKGLTIYEEIKNKASIAKSLGNIGTVYNSLSDYQKATKYYLQALTLAKELNDNNLISINLGNIGLAYSYQGDYAQALDYYFKALKISEELNDKFAVTRHLANIGIVYERQANYTKALVYYSRALKLAEETGNKNLTAGINGIIGVVYYYKKEYPQALTYCFKALKLAEELGDKNGIAKHLCNIGLAYSSQAYYDKNNPNNSEKFNQALEYYLRALKLAEELGNKYTLAVNLGNIGELYGEIGKYSLAESYLLRAIKTDIEIGSKDDERKDEQRLSQLYEKLGKAQLALNHFKRAMELKDTIFSQENHKQLVEKELNFEYQKKELATKAEQNKKDAIVKEEKEKQKIVIILVSIVCGLVVIFSFFLFNRFRITNKQKLIIEQQKTQVDEAYDELHQKNKEMMDSIHYAKRIQTALLPTEKYIQRVLEDKDKK